MKIKIPKEKIRVVARAIVTRCRACEGTKKICWSCEQDAIRGINAADDYDKKARKALRDKS